MHNKIDTPDSGSSVVSGLQFLNIEHWGKFAISLAAAVLTLGPGAEQHGRTRGDPITNTNMEVRDSEGPQHQRSSLVDRAVNGTFGRFHNAWIRPPLGPSPC